jgi:RNA polymerase sigma-70 factor, ECF subfamily
MTDTDLSDHEIVTRIYNGEKELYRNIMERYGSLVFHVVRKYEKDDHMVREMAHEIFLKAWERLESWKGNSAFSSWLFRLAQNHCIDRYRRKKQHDQLFADMPEDHSAVMTASNPSPDDGLLHNEQASRLRKALDKIKEEYALPLLMKYRDGMSYESISEALDVPIGALKVRVHRARKELKTQLENMQ